MALLGVLVFILIFFCEFRGCLVGLWRRSGVQGSRSEVSRFVFLGEDEFGVPKLGHRCALKLWKGSGREPGEDKGSGSRWNALIAIERRGRIPGCLAYGRRAKWIPMESTIRSPPTDLMQSNPGHCSLSFINREGEVST